MQDRHKQHSKQARSQVQEASRGSKTLQIPVADAAAPAVVTASLPAAAAVAEVAVRAAVAAVVASVLPVAAAVAC
jgi:hypothetical protein